MARYEALPREATWNFSGADEAAPILAFIQGARADVPDLAAFVLRVTAPEMRATVENVLRMCLAMGDLPGAVRRIGPEDAPHMADAIMALLTETDRS